MRTCMLFVGVAFSFYGFSQEPLYNYIFFNNSRMPGNYFFSKTTATQPSSVINRGQHLPVTTESFHSAGNSLKLDYVNGSNGSWMAGLYRQPVRGQDNFHTIGAFSFYLKIQSPGTSMKHLPALQLMKDDSSLTAKFTLPVKVSNQWQHVVIPIDQLQAVDASNPSGIIGVIFSQNGDDGKKHQLYVDDIEFLPVHNNNFIKAIPAITHCKGYPKHIDIAWRAPMDSAVKYIKVYRSENGKAFKSIGIQSPRIQRYADFTGKTGRRYYYKIAFVGQDDKETKASAAKTSVTRKMSDDELLTMVQEACFRYYWEAAEIKSGLAKENIQGRENMIASGAAGFGVMAILAGTHRQFISRQQSVERFLKIVRFLDTAATFHGAYSHFIDGPTGKAEPFFGNKDNGGDLVETSFLLQGLLTARSFFNANNAEEKEIRDKITAIWKKVEWDWYRQYPGSKFLYWHWSPDQAFVINHNLIGWNEVMVTYLLAIASPTHAIPASMYYTGWANQDSTGRKYREGWGATPEGSAYTNGNTYYGIKLDVGVSNGGPLFFTHYSYLGYDPHAITDKYTNYFKNNQDIANINYRYCLANPGKHKGYGDSCWGLTASDGPYHYSANEPVLRQDEGKIAPTGAISSFPYTPEASMKALKNYYNNYGQSMGRIWL
jgi:hypothetical protein